MATPRPAVAWVLWALGGLAGAHRLYIGPRWLGALMLVANATMLAVTGGLWLLPAVMWWLGDGWRVPERLAAARAAAADEAVRVVLDGRAPAAVAEVIPLFAPPVSADVAGAGTRS